MRVLVTVPSLDAAYGGPVAKARALVAALRECGAHAQLAGAGTAVENEVALERIGGFHGTPIPRTLRPLVREVRRAEVVHVLGYRDPVGTAAFLIARPWRVPVVWEPCGMHRRRLRSLRLKALFDAGPGRMIEKTARRVVATSRLEAGELAADGLPAARIAIRPNGVDFSGLVPPPSRGRLRQALGIPPEAPLVLALGRITAKKGLLDLAEAVAGLAGAHALVAGPDDGDGTLPALLARRRAIGLEGRLHILARGLWGADKAQAFADADCFCLPSASENFGIAAAEAAGCGLPVVVSQECGVAEFLQPSACRVIAHGDVDELRRALGEVLSQPVRAAARAQAPRLRRSLDWQVLAREQLAIYEEAVKEARR